MIAGTMPEDMDNRERKVRGWQVELSRSWGQYCVVPEGKPQSSRSRASRYEVMLSERALILPLRTSWEMATAVKSFEFEQMRNCWPATGVRELKARGI